MRRAFWLAVGFALGVAAARRARGRATGGGVEPRRGLSRRLRAHVEDAIAAGRDEARQREAALRAVLASPDNGAREAER